MNDCAPDPKFDPASCELTVNRWVVGELAEAAKRVSVAIEAYKFNEAADALYHFAWGTFCDWYLEFIKPVLMGDDEAARAETRACAAWALGQIFHLLHPFMPFISEELWEVLSVDGEPLVRSPWPDLSADVIDASAGAEMDWVIRLIGQVRTVRAELNVPAGAKIEMRLLGASDVSQSRLEAHDEVIRRLARLSSVQLNGETPKGSVQAVLDEATIVLPLTGVIDVDEEKKRLSREIQKAQGEIAKIDKKLGNEKFLSKAPAEVIEEQRRRRAEEEQTQTKLSDALERLAAVE